MRSSVVVFSLLGACAAPTVATPPPPVVAPSPAAVLVVPEVASSAPPRPAPPPPMQVADAAGVQAFLTDLCTHANADGASWFEAHVRVPLFGSDYVDPEEPDAQQSGRYEQKPADFASGSLCKAPLTAGAIAVEEHGAKVTIGGHPHRLVFEGAGETARLVELSYVPPTPPPRVTKQKPRKWEIDGNLVHGTGEPASVIGPWMVGEMRRHPACVKSYAAWEKTSAAMHVVARKRDGEDATVRVFPSTMVRTSLLRCLEPQLNTAVAALFRGVPFEVDYLIRVALPMSASEVGPGDVVMDVGP